MNGLVLTAALVSVGLFLGAIACAVQGNFPGIIISGLGGCVMAGCAGNNWGKP